MPASLPAPLDSVAAQAAEAGLELRGALPAAPLEDRVMTRVDAWLQQGAHGEMDYLARGRPAMADLRAWKPWVRGALLFRLPYHRAGGGFRGGGRVARYALGRDYHHVLGRRLEKLGRRLRRDGSAQRFRAVVDAAPVLEREWALRAGVGFRGKNTLVLDPEHGPWVLLGELLLDAELPAWSPTPARTATCGSCTRCLDACPTGAFPVAHALDARRCISYLTIETRDWIPRELRPLMGDWVFGCDRCLEVCPFGHHAGDHADAWGVHPAIAQHGLDDLLVMDEQVFHERFTGSPLRRPGWAGMLRNACIVLGNLGRGTGALEGALEHPEAVVRGHAAWALGRQGEAAGLRRRLDRERDPAVCEEIAAGLEEAAGRPA